MKPYRDLAPAPPKRPYIRPKLTRKIRWAVWDRTLGNKFEAWHLFAGGDPTETKEGYWRYLRSFLRYGFADALRAMEKPWKPTTWWAHIQDEALRAQGVFVQGSHSWRP